MSRCRISYAKVDGARFISHLDLISIFERAVRRARLPVSLSRGFNPHPKMSFGFPLPVGMAGTNECLDIDLYQDVDPGQMARSLNAVMPPGIEIKGARLIDEKTPALMAEVESAWYHVLADVEEMPEIKTLQASLDNIMGQKEIKILRKKKDGRVVEYDIRAGILALSAGQENGRILVAMHLLTGSRMNVRVQEVIKVMTERFGIFKSGVAEVIRVLMIGRGGKELY